MIGGDLPPGWEMTTVGAVCSTQLGKMLSRKAKTGEDEQPYLRNQNVQWGRIDLEDLLTMTFTKAEREKFGLQPGDVLVCEGGVVGRAAVWRAEQEVFFQKALHRLRCRDGISPEWIAHAFRFMADFNLFGDFSSGSTIAHLPQEDLRLLPLPLPPTNEQIRIVHELDRRLSHVAAAEQTLRRVMRQCQHLRLSILRDAFAGRLHAPGEERSDAQEVSTAVSDMNSGAPWELPSQWTWMTLGDVGRWGSGGTPKAGTKEFYGGPIPWAVIGDLNDAVVSQTSSSITELGLDKSSAKKVPAGTLLVAMYGSIGKLGIAGTEMATNQAIAHVIPSPGIEMRYLYWWLFLQRDSLLAAGQGGTQKNISQSILKAWPVPVAPQDDQRRLVAEIDRRMTLVQAAESGISRQLERSDLLRKTLLSAAFRGELVEQDPADEGALSILRRIDEESKQSEGGRVQRRRASAPKEAAK